MVSGIIEGDSSEMLDTNGCDNRVDILTLGECMEVPGHLLVTIQNHVIEFLRSTLFSQLSPLPNLRQIQCVIRCLYNLPRQ